MSTSATEISIANRALLSVGARAQVSSINPSDGSVEANAISVLWTPTFEALARTARWNCLRKQITLSLYAAAKGTPENPDGTAYPLPPSPWLYTYLYPSDCLYFNYVVPSYPMATGSATPATTYNNSAGNYVSMSGQIPFVVSSDADAVNNPIQVIYTNQEQAIGVYSANIPNPSLWDSLFQEAMVASLAVYLVPALSLSMPLLQMSVSQADKIIATARAQDGNEGVTTMDHLPDWMRARLGGSGYGVAVYPPTYGWQNMSWPSWIE